MCSEKKKNYAQKKGLICIFVTYEERYLGKFSREKNIYVYVFYFRISRFQSFRSSLQASFSAAHSETLALSTIVENLNKSFSDAKFTQAEIDAAVERMTNDNHIMVSEGNVFLV